MNKLFKKLYGIIKADYIERNTILNLNASENHMSQVAKNILGSHPAYDCYEFPPSGGNIIKPWTFSGPPFNEKILKLISLQCSKMFDSKHVNVRAKGGQAAEIAVLLGLTKSGDHVFYVDEQCGGHFGLTNIAKRCNIALHSISFNPTTHLIDLKTTLHNMQQTWTQDSLKLMIVNQSFILQQQNWYEIVTDLKKIYPDIIISCDVSHLLGLIIGKKIQNPLHFGVDLIHGSTHKTFPGPQKAIIVFNPKFNRDKASAIERAISPLLQSNCGTAEIIVLAYVLYEMSIQGCMYAKAICDNAKTLAITLAELQINVIGQSFGYTQTHQCWIAIGNELEAWQACGLLHEAGLRSLPAYLPFVKTWGLRFGVNALTRRGLAQQQFIQIAKWISELLSQKTKTAVIRKEVTKLSKYFPLSNLSYTLDVDYLAAFSNMFLTDSAT